MWEVGEKERRCLDMGMIEGKLGMRMILGDPGARLKG